MDTNSSSDFQRQMPQVRGRLDRDSEQLVKDTERLVKKTKEQMNWKHLVAEHPWASMAAAAAIGYVVVPRRSCTVTVDWKSIRQAMPEGASPLPVRKEPRKESAFSSLFSNMLGFAASLAFRQVATLVSEQVRHMVSEYVQSIRSGAGGRQGGDWEPSRGESYGFQQTTKREDGRRS